MLSPDQNPSKARKT